MHHYAHITRPSEPLIYSLNRTINVYGFYKGLFVYLRSSLQWLVYSQMNLCESVILNVEDFQTVAFQRFGKCTCV